MTKKKRLFNEWCPLCSTENEFEYKGMKIYRCRECGFAMIPCSLCNTNISVCGKCWLSKEANRENQVSTL